MDLKKAKSPGRNDFDTIAFAIILDCKGESKSNIDIIESRLFIEGTGNSISSLLIEKESSTLLSSPSEYSVFNVFCISWSSFLEKLDQWHHN